MKTATALTLAMALGATGCVQTPDLPWTPWTATPRVTTVETATGTAVELRTYVFWTSDCGPAESTVEVTETPDHGRIEFVQVSDEIPAVPRGGTVGACTGTVIPGTQVRYIPTDGFIGTDTVTVFPRGETGEAIDEFRITVTAPPSY